MKNQLITLAAAALLAPAVFAAGNVSKWTGNGTAYTPDGKVLGQYQVSVVNTELVGNVVQSDTTMTLPDGTQKTISQKLTMSGNGWSDDSNLGKGGGTCYGADLCENYITGENGLAYATTIITDSPNNRRDMTIKLQDGKAVEVLRESLVRSN